LRSKLQSILDLQGANARGTPEAISQQRGWQV
jgi:hypothetical protein